MDHWGSNIAGGLFLSAVILLVVFLIFREFFCWYWKINQSIALLTEIRDQLAVKEISHDGALSVARKSAPLTASSAGSSAEKVSKGPPANADSTCPNGNCSAPVRHDDQTCWKCGADFSHPNGWKPKRSRIATSLPMSASQGAAAKFCSGCGAAANEAGSAFCEKCGAKL